MAIQILIPKHSHLICGIDIETIINMKYILTTLLLLAALSQSKAQSWATQIGSALNRGEVSLVFNNQPQEQKLLDYINSYRRLHLNHTALFQDSLSLNTYSKRTFEELSAIETVDSLNSKVFSSDYSTQIINQIYYAQSDSLTITSNELNNELLNQIYVQCMSNAMYNWIDNEKQNKLLTKDDDQIATTSKLVLNMTKQGNLINVNWKYLGSFSVAQQPQELLAVNKKSRKRDRLLK